MEDIKDIKDAKDNIENINIEYFEKLITPLQLKTEISIDKEITDFVIESRKTISNIIKGIDKRLLCVIGPCSIHDVGSAYEYAKLLKKISDKHFKNVFIVMRTYFEKPRTTIGWKGLINDPDLNGNFNVNKGLKLSRQLLLDINKLGIPCGYEVLDSITPQYISDLISWGAIGARTTESQVHRQIVSGMSVPIGFKNGTTGDIDVALNAIISSKHPHCFMGISNEGIPSICKTKGNPYSHLILRGGKSGPNYYPENIQEIMKEMDEYNSHNNNIIDNCIIVDCSHGNSKKDFRNQKKVLYNIYEQINNGNTYIKGFMMESNINEGKQSLPDIPTKDNLKYGVSITDSCISIKETEEIFNELFS